MSRKITRNVGFRRFKVGMAIVVAGVSHVWMLWDLWMSSIDPLQTGAPGALFLSQSRPNTLTNESMIIIPLTSCGVPTTSS